MPYSGADRPIARAVGVLAAWIALLATPACVRRPPAAPADLALPESYRVEADGELRLDGLRLPGRLRMEYLVNPDGSVLVSDLTAWIRDVDIVTHFLFWETNRERLRCTKLSNVLPIGGRLEADGRLVIPNGSASLSGVSFSERGPDRTCPGLARQVTARNNAEIVLTHDPVGDRFGMSGSFRGAHGDDEVTIRIEMNGRYLNRPPRALLGVYEPTASGGTGAAEPGPLTLPQGGCPPIRGLNPPGAVANRPEGLLLNLISLSSDPDGRAGPGRGRGDVARDVWSHASGGAAFRSLGNRQIVGPVLFELHRDHVLALTTTDHSRAASRMTCRFRVITAAEAGLGGGS
jgi:hypothetical protein